MRVSAVVNTLTSVLGSAVVSFEPVLIRTVVYTLVDVLGAAVVSFMSVLIRAVINSSLVLLRAVIYNDSVHHGAGVTTTLVDRGTGVVVHTPVMRVWTRIVILIVVEGIAGVDSKRSVLERTMIHGIVTSVLCRARVRGVNDIGISLPWGIRISSRLKYAA